MQLLPIRSSKFLITYDISKQNIGIFLIFHIPLCILYIVYCTNFTRQNIAKYGKDKARQDKTRQDKTRQDKTRQDKTRQDKTRQDNTRQDKTRQDKTRQDKTRQDKTRQDKTRQDKTRQDKTNKTRQDKARQRQIMTNNIEHKNYLICPFILQFYSGRRQKSDGTIWLNSPGKTIGCSR
ncbi:hypothetical protein B5S27_g4912 [[Candida] boidinii]|nr:hypothetical protein B5S27_g4912 [[Candida] boidinii]